MYIYTCKCKLKVQLVKLKYYLDVLMDSIFLIKRNKNDTVDQP